LPRCAASSACPTSGQTEATHCQIQDGALIEVITFSNAPNIHATDYLFV
jgi:hypothetical protein